MIENNQIDVVQNTLVRCNGPVRVRILGSFLDDGEILESRSLMIILSAERLYRLCIDLSFQVQILFPVQIT